MEIKELLDLFVAERTTAYLHGHTDADREKCDMLAQWIELLKKEAPDLVERYQEYLERLDELQGEEETTLYLFGLGDGLRIARYLEDIIYKEA